MDAEFSLEQEQLRDSVRRFLAERAPIAWVRSTFDAPTGTEPAVWAGLAELGVLGLCVPEDGGGAGPDLVSAGVVLEELGRAVHPGPYVASAVAAATAVRAGGDGDDRARWLPALADGSAVGTLAVYEPGARYAWEAPATRAEGSGERWTLHGEKAWVPEAVGADWAVVVADDGAGAGAGLALFVVPLDGVGVTVTPTATLDPTRRFATVALDGAVGFRLGGADPVAAVGEALDVVAVALVVDGLGAAAAVLELAVAYAKERHQFGVPIGSFQAVQHLCADMLRDLEVARGGAYYALWACDAAPAAERHRAATMTKAFAGEALPRVGANAIQVFGGVGFTWEHDAHLYWKRLLTMQSAFGDPAAHLDDLAAFLLD